MVMANEAVKLVTACVKSADVDKCSAICQKCSLQPTTGTENGRKRIREAASIRNDSTNRRLKLIGDGNFVYHMNNECYKAYTLRKTLEKIEADKTVCAGQFEVEADGNSESFATVPNVRSKNTPRPGPSPQIDIYRQKCVICGCVKHQGLDEKYRISESNRALKFLEASVFIQDDVYTRTCDLQDVNSVFGADLYCHKICVNRYIQKYEREFSRKSNERHRSCKQKAWSDVVCHIEMGLCNGEGYELSYVRDIMNKKLESENTVSNREVKVLLMCHFGDNIRFSRPKQLTKSVMFFGNNVTAETMAETIRNADPVRECALLLRQSLLETDFDLNDRFCDASDLEKSWNKVKIPEPLLKFFATLYNFNADAFDAPTVGQIGTTELNDEIDRPTLDEPEGVSECKYRQMHALFQTMYYDLYRGRKRTPIHLMNSQAIYDACKSATLITTFNHFGMCSSYDELMRHHNDMASFTIESSNETVPFPNHFESGSFTLGAFDNFDHDEATLSGMDGSHDKVTVLFQESGSSAPRKPKILETNIQHGPKTFNTDLKCQQLKQFSLSLPGRLICLQNTLFQPLLIQSKRIY